MVRYSPIIVAVLLIVGLTIVEVNMTDRLAGTNVTAEQRVALLEKVPSVVGDWHGDDVPVDPSAQTGWGDWRRRSRVSQRPHRRKSEALVDRRTCPRGF